MSRGYQSGRTRAAFREATNPYAPAGLVNPDFKMTPKQALALHDKQEDRNDHSRNFLLMAQAVGSKADIAEAQKYIDLRAKNGGLTGDEVDARAKYFEKLNDKFEQFLKPAKDAQNKFGAKEQTSAANVQEFNKRGIYGGAYVDRKYGNMASGSVRKLKTAFSKSIDEKALGPNDAFVRRASANIEAGAARETIKKLASSYNITGPQLDKILSFLGSNQGKDYVKSIGDGEKAAQQIGMAWTVAARIAQPLGNQQKAEASIIFPMPKSDTGKSQAGEIRFIANSIGEKGDANMRETQIEFRQHYRDTSKSFRSYVVNPDGTAGKFVD